jgi:hypothetical protein
VHRPNRSQYRFRLLEQLSRWIAGFEWGETRRILSQNMNGNYHLIADTSSPSTGVASGFASLLIGFLTGQRCWGVPHSLCSADSEHAICMGGIFRIADLLQYVPMLYGLAIGIHLEDVDAGDPTVFRIVVEQIDKWTCAQT